MKQYIRDCINPERAKDIREVYEIFQREMRYPAVTERREFESWLRGLADAVQIAFIDYEIENLGYNPETYWTDITNTFFEMLEEEQ